MKMEVIAISVNGLNNECKNKQYKQQRWATGTWHIFFVVKSTSHETNGSRRNRLDARQKWLEPTWNVQVDLKSTSQVDSQVC